MKLLKYLFLCFFTFLLIACNKGEKDIITQLGQKLDDTTSYYSEANMVVKQNNLARNYLLKVSVKGDTHYKVELNNLETSNAQIIIKNNDGVFVLTPSLNKSFKFNSTWPLNSSHSYLFESLIHDIINDDSPEIETTDDSYVITVNINDQVQTQLSSLKASFDKETLKPKEAVLYNKDNQEVTKITFTKFEFNPDIDDSIFEIKKSINDERDKGVSAPVNREITYPSYIPIGTALDKESKLPTKAMMTFSGTSSFTVVQEFVDDSTSVSTSNVIGDIIITSTGVAAISSSSIMWVQNGIEFMVFSETLPRNELIRIANSFVMSDEK